VERSVTLYVGGLPLRFSPKSLDRCSLCRNLKGRIAGDDLIVRSLFLSDLRSRNWNSRLEPTYAIERPNYLVFCDAFILSNEQRLKHGLATRRWRIEVNDRIAWNDAPKSDHRSNRLAFSRDLRLRGCLGRSAPPNRDEHNDRNDCKNHTDPQPASRAPMGCLVRRWKIACGRWR
jgi:hypothetical protein